MPCLVLFCLAFRCLVVSCLVFRCFVSSCLVLSCLSLPGLVLRCLVLACLALPCAVLFCLVLSCLVLSCLALPCLVLCWLVLSCVALLFSCFGLSCVASCCLVLSCLALPCFILSCLRCLVLSCFALSCVVLCCLVFVSSYVVQCFVPLRCVVFCWYPVYRMCMNVRPLTCCQCTVCTCFWGHHLAKTRTGFRRVSQVFLVLLDSCWSHFWVMYPQGWLLSPSVTVLDAASGLHLKRWVAGAYVSIKPGCHTGAQTGTAGYCWTVERLFLLLFSCRWVNVWFCSWPFGIIWIHLPCLVVVDLGT